MTRERIGRRFTVPETLCDSIVVMSDRNSWLPFVLVLGTSYPLSQDGCKHFCQRSLSSETLGLYHTAELGFPHFSWILM